jgi:hypothetical protein
MYVIQIDYHLACFRVKFFVFNFEVEGVSENNIHI